jgi:hypothetical protein
MSQRANPTVVGAFVVSALALLVFGILVFGSGAILRERTPIVAFFSGNVRGLQKGSAVEFRGVRVGTVSRVICTGGGGIPVMRHANGSLSGVEAVIDKDAASALLAQQLKADALLLLTDVDAVYRDFGTDSQSPIDELAFAEQGGMAGIGRLADAVQILAGSAGTRIKG